MDNYIIYNGELYHHGVKGMKWGVRRYQNKDGTLTRAGKRKKAKEDYENEIEAKRKSLNAEAEKLFAESKEGKWRKKHPGRDIDDFGDEVWDDPDFEDPKADQARALAARAGKLDKTYSRAQALGSAIISGVYLSPIASFVTAKATKGTIKNGKARVAAILGSGAATAGVMSLWAYASAKSEQRKAIKSEGIKSVKERMKEMG